ncbi:unnamed protein product [Pylaiella littoralis]
MAGGLFSLRLITSSSCQLISTATERQHTFV